MVLLPGFDGGREAGVLPCARIQLWRYRPEFSPYPEFNYSTPLLSISCAGFSSHAFQRSITSTNTGWTTGGKQLNFGVWQFRGHWPKP
jgi:hypothetical protein